MIYDEYKAKVAKIARFLTVVRRFRVIILSVLLTVVGISTALLATSGTVYDDASCPTQIVYGDKLRYEANAFLSQVSYEFYDPVTGEWTAEVPKTPGEYKVRAVSKGAFGGKKVGKAHAFVIEPKEIVFTAAETVLEYGATATATGELFEGESVECTEFSYTGLDTEQAKIEPNAESITVYDKNGNDITHCYEVKTAATDISFTKRALAITVEDASRVYDGKPFTYEEYALTGGSLAFEDELQAVFTESVTYVDEIKENVATLTIYNAEGVDVTEYYDITTSFGTLSIEKYDLLVKTPSQQKVYDGTPLTAASFELPALPEGHEATVGKAASQTTVGKTQNIVEVEIFDANGTDRTYNFNITYPEESILEVFRRKVVVKSHDAERAYNGEAFLHKEWSLEDGYSFAANEHGAPVEENWGSIVYKGNAENTFALKVFDANDNDTTENYRIEYVYGTLTVNAATLAFTSDSGEKVYDGTKLIKDGVTITDGALGKGDRIVLDSWSERIDAGETENVITYRILNEKDENMGENYDVSLSYGMLTVAKRQISVTVLPAEKIYDGTPLTSDAVQADEELPTGHTVSADPQGERTEKGTAENVLDKTTVTVAFGEKDATDNFEIVGVTNGVLTVTARPIYVTTHDCEWIYDGLVHMDGDGAGNTYAYGADDLTVGEKDGIEYYSLVDGHALAVAEANEIRFFVESGRQNQVRFAITKEETPYTDNYEITVETTGVLTIARRAISVRSLSAEKVYDGTVLEMREVELFDGTTLAPNEYLEAYYTAYALNANTYDNTFEVEIFNAENDSTTENYEIKREYGALTVTKRNIVFATGSDSKIYDGKALQNEDSWTEAVAPLTVAIPEGHEFWATFSGEQTDAGDSPNTAELTIYRDGEPANDNFEIEYRFGTLTVTPRPITVLTHSHEWIYDGQAHADSDGCELSGYTNADLTGEYLLVDGHTLRVDKPASVTNTWDSVAENNRLELLVYDGERNVTDNYEIAYEYGTLTVTPRPITVQTHTHEWIYDGEYHSDNKVDCNHDGYYTKADIISEDTLVDGQILIVSWINAGVVEVNDGEVDNDLEVVVYSEDETVNYTKNYEIAYKYGTIKILPRPITVKTHDHEWYYDGEYHADENCAAGYDNTDLTGEYLLVDGHALVAVAFTYIRDTWETQAQNNGVTFTVVNALGTSMEDNYEISYEYGTLTILKRPLLLQTGSTEKIYDGEPLTYSVFRFVYYEPLTFDFPASDYYEIDFTGSQTNKGTSDNTCEVFIFRGEAPNGEPIDDNYEITYEYGKLNVLPRPIKILTHDHDKMYDGESLSCAACAYDESDMSFKDGVDYDLVKDHAIYVAEAHEIVNVTESGANYVKFGIVGAEGDVTDNYVISRQLGWLEITKRPIKLVTHTHEWVYENIDFFDDGSCGCEYGGAEHGALVVEEPDYYALADGEALRPLTYTTIRTVGDKRNEITFAVEKDGDPTTDNYEITYEYGWLTVTKRPILILTHTHTWLYDGKEHSDFGEDCDCGGYSAADVIGEYGLLEGHEIELFTAYSSVTNVWDSGVENKVGFLVYEDETRTPSENYKIDFQFGTLHIDARPITVAADSAEKVYDGTPLTVEKDKFSVVSETLPVAGHKVSVQTLGATRTDAGGTDNLIVGNSCEITDAKGANVTKNYYISYENGVVNVLQRPIIIRLHSHEWVYDGAEHYDDCAYGEAEMLLLADVGYPLVTGHTLSVVERKTIVNTWESEERDDWVGLAVFCGEADVSHNYAFEYEKGMLTITARAIYLETNDREWLYDGAEHYDGEDDPFAYTAENLLVGESDGVEYDTLLDGHTFVVVKTDKTATVQTYVESGLANFVDFEIYDGENSVRKNYAIRLKTGTLSILQRHIYVTTHDYTWNYDGKEHSEIHEDEYGYTAADMTVGFVDGEEYFELVDGHALAIKKSASIKNVAESYKANEIVFDVYSDSGAVTDNYKITVNAIGVLVVSAREIEVKAASAEYIYDGEEHVIEPNDYEIVSETQLVDGHTMSVFTTGQKGTEVGNYGNGIIWDSAQIKDGEEDVTDNYLITYTPGSLKILQRPILFVNNDVEFMYDGMAHEDETDYDASNLHVGEYEGVEYFGLLEGHTLKAVYRASATDWQELGYENKMEIWIFDAAGNEVTDCYQREYLFGILTIQQRPILLITDDVSFMYDGMAHKDERAYDADALHVGEFDGLEYYALVDGHVLKTEWTREITFFAENGANEIVVNVETAEGKPIGHNYSVAYFYGRLEITPRPIHVQTHEHEFVYNGKPQYDPCQYTRFDLLEGEGYYTLVLGDTFEVSEYTYVVNVSDGDVKNELKLLVYRYGTNISDNYEIKYTPGTLRVTKASLRVRTHSHQWEYDGQPHMDDCVYTADDLDVSGEYCTIAEGQHFEIDASQPQTKVTYVAEGKKKNTLFLLVKDGETDVSGNYHIEYEKGTLEILPRKITITSDSAEKIFNGEPLTASGWSITEGSVVDGETLTVTCNGSQTNAYVRADDEFGRSLNTFTYTLTRGENKIDSRGNYEFTTVYGTLTVYKRPIHVTTHSYSWMYDGEWHRDESSYGSEDLFVGEVEDQGEYYPLLENDYLSVTGNRISVKYYSDSQRNILKFHVNDSASYSKNYHIEYVYGYLEITKRPIKITTHTKSFVYNGYDQYDTCAYTNEDLTEGDGFYLLVDGDYLETLSYTTVKEVKDGVKKNEMTFDVKCGRNSIEENYTFSFDYGDIDVTPRPITVAAKTAVKEYDGKPLSVNAGEYDITNGSLVAGHVLAIDTLGASLDGTSVEEVAHLLAQGTKAVITDRGDDVTDNYDISYADGVLRITKRHMTVAAKSVEKEYDRDPIVVNAGEYVIESGSLLDGHQLTIATEGATLDGLGEIQHYLSDGAVAEIKDRNGVDVSQFYEISYQDGWLRILPRKVSIESASDEKYYDGEPLVKDEFTPENFLNGHKLHVVITGSQTEVGESANTIDEYTIYDEYGNNITHAEYYDVTCVEGMLVVVLNTGNEGGSSGSGGSGDNGDGNPDFYVTASRDGELYVRENSYGNYQLGGWSTEPRAYDDGTLSPLFYAGKAAENSGAQANNVVLETSKELPYLTPYYAAENSALTNDLTANSTWTGTQTFTYYSYDGRDLSLSGTAYAAAEAEYRNFVYSYYTFLPESSRTKMLQIGAANNIQSGATVIDDIATLVKGYFTERKILEKTYTGDFAAFFFEQADGAMARHYVTAATVMLRAYGIPARYTYGYKMDLLANERMGAYKMRDAYEWVEVYIDGMGWIPVDVVGPTSMYPKDASGGFGSMTGMLDSKGAIFDDADGEPIFYVTANETRMLYLRQTSFGDYLACGWDAAKYYDDGVLSPLYYGGQSAKANGVQPLSVLIESEYENGPYLMPYYVANGASVLTNDVKPYYAWSDSYSIEYYPHDGRDLSLSATSYSAAEAAYREYVYEYYTALPASTKAKMLEIGAANGIEKNATILDDVAAFVSNHVPYNKFFEKEFTGDYAVFFFEKADGAICQHYATAATALLRAYGIPARYTGGYVAYAVENETVGVTAAQAHAWVEVYIDGMGWTPLEVTGAGGIGGGDGILPGDGENNEDGENDDQTPKTQLTVKPVDRIASATKTTLLVHDGALEDGGNSFDFGNLILQGYYYEVIVNGVQEGVGVSSATIEPNSLILYDPNGKNVTDEYEFIFEEGKLEITESYVVYIELEENVYTYDGTEKRYAEDSYWRVDEKLSGIPENAVVDFRIGEVAGITEVGKISDEELVKHVTVTLDGVDITDLCVFAFSEFRLSIEKRAITLQSDSQSKVYDGTPLEAENVQIVFHSLVNGHTLYAKAVGSITEEGKIYNTIDSVLIKDENGKDVTDNYDIEFKLGILEILPEV